MATYNGPTVDVNIFLQTRPIATQNFKYPMVIIPHNLTSGVVDSFASLDGVISAGAAVNSPLYQFAAGLTGGIAAPDLIKFARADLETITLTVDSVPEVGEDITVNCKVNGVAASVSFEIADAGDTDAAATGLAAALALEYPTGGTNPAFSAAGSVVTATIASDTVPTSIGWATIDSNGYPHITVEDTTGDVLADVIATAASSDDDFSFVLAESHADSDITSLAAYAVSASKQYYVSTSDIKAKDNTDNANIATVLGALGQDEVSLQWSKAADTHFPEAALVGNICSIDPYRLNNQNLVTLSGIPVDSLTETEIVTLTDRNVNYYVSEYGSGAYHEGWTMGGNFVDTIRFAQWFKVRCEEALYLLFKNAADSGSAVAYSDTGKLKMESRIRNDVVNVGIRGGTIATGNTTDPVTGSTINLDPYIDFGTRAQQTNNNIAQRVWADGIAEVVYQSGINHVKLNGYVILNRDPS
ncbi:hypothetical protein [Vibrio phage S4-7]|nr:hypothetical protein [Vibrio phage S4-7]